MKGPRANSILVVDDDPVAANLLVEVLCRDGYAAIATERGDDAIAAARNRAFDAALVDLRMPDMDGLQVLKTLRQIQPDLPVIILTAFADMATAVRAIDMGAIDYLSKPFRMEEIRAVLQRILKDQRLARHDRGKSADAAAAPEFLIGASPPMIAVYKLIAKLANLDSTVLIGGETGTGKEQVARAIHLSGNRRALPFATIDCTSLPETLFESELFGHERGAFTGAHAARRGIFETAGAGTCFLDEIGELPPQLQPKLLRAIQERAVRRVGGTATIPIRARIITATNRDLAKMVRDGQFREDLFYRLNVVTITLPRLRDRREDIPPLAEHFVRRFATRNAKQAPRLSPGALEALSAYHWPGNVRQLENVIERTLALTGYGTVLAEDLPPEIRESEPCGSNAMAGTMADEAPSTLKALSDHHVLDVLSRAGGNKSQAARILGIDRRTLYRILERTATTGGDGPG